jgi:endonuclease/exonuclease/phosphatase (EEP) superfamily protein YafD
VRRLGWVLTSLLVVAGAALTLARVWQPATGPLAETQVRLAALVPLAIPVYAAALVCAGLLGLRSGPSLRLPAVAGLALLGLVAHLWWFAPFLTDESGTAPGASPVLRVLTVNAYIHHGATGSDLVRLAADADADVVVLQELGGPTYDEALRAGLVAAYPRRTRAPDAGDSATMVWSRLPLRAVRTIPDTSGGGSLRFVVETVDGGVDVLGVHTAPPIWLDLWRTDHTALLEQVRDQRPDLVVGDLNATADHLQLRRLGDLGLRDAGDVTGSGWAPTWPSNGIHRFLGLPAPRFAAIDHVLVAPHWTVVSLRRLHVARSDHTAVLAEVVRS